MLQITAEKLAVLIDGEIQGNSNQAVQNFAKLEEAKANELSFLSSEKYLNQATSTKASIIIANQDLKSVFKHENTIIWVSDARACFGKLLAFYVESTKEKKSGISKLAAVHDGVKVADSAFIDDFVSIKQGSVIHENVIIHPSVSIGKNVTIGAGTEIYAGVQIYDNTVIGENCVIQSGAVLGGDGFGFAPNSDNQYNKIYHIGNVIIEDHVEIGASTTIDKATVGSTIIRKGVKLDNLIQVAHNVEIGRNTVIAAQTGIAGSTKIGANCMIGGQVGIVGHIEIADEVKIAAQSGISRSITQKGQIVQGSPALPISDYKKSFVLFKNLPTLKKQIDNLSVKG